MRGACPRDLDQSIRSRAGACLSGSAAADVERLKRVRIGCGPGRARPIQIAPSPDRPAPIRVATDPDPLAPIWIATLSGSAQSAPERLRSGSRQPPIRSGQPIQIDPTHTRSGGTFCRRRGRKGVKTQPDIYQAVFKLLWGSFKTHLLLVHRSLA